MRRRNAILVFALFLLALFGIAVFAVISFPKGAPILRVTFLDVGQGDAILFRTPGGQDILIDGGPDASVLDGLGRELSFFDRTVELLLLTHPDADHFQGQIDIFERYRVRRIVTNGTAGKAPSYRVWEERAKAEGAALNVACAGQEFRFDHDITLRIASPACGAAQSDETNDDSLLMVLTYGSTSFLLTGDATIKAEHVALPQLSDVDVLKVGHHGSKTSTSSELLDAVKPEIAILSVGADNRYGHPHESVLTRLTERTIRIFRTDRTGNIRCRSDGKAVSCE